ncbi:MAG: hypothetical protein Kow0092_29650 [Deferrisomatales bacterium]
MLVLAMVAGLLSAAEGHSLAASDERVPVRILGAGQTRVTSARAEKVGTELRVRGRVWDLLPSLVRGHVDVVACTEQGTVVRALRVPLFPRARQGRGRRTASFTATISAAGVDQVPAEVRVAWHGAAPILEGPDACAPLPGEGAGGRP